MLGPSWTPVDTLLKRGQCFLQVTLGTNYFGPLLLTHLLLDNLRENAPARIVNQGSISEQMSGGVYWDDLK